METKELEMFDENYQIISHAKANDPATSFMAAAVAVKSFETNKKKVREIFRDVAPNGLINEELEVIAQARGMRPQAASKRRSDLSNMGELVWRGEYRVTDSGCKAKVWHIA
jgi:hypothetical protein